MMVFALPVYMKFMARFRVRRDFKWYIGPGVHIGAYSDNHHHHDGDDHHSHPAIGIDGVIGLDYKFNGAPINLSLDWQPSFEFADGHGFIGSWGGLGIRYTF